MAFASQIHPKRLRRHQTPRKPLIFKGFPGLLCIKVERVLDPASGSQKQRSKYTDPFSRLSNQSTPVSIQLSATQFAPIDDTFSSEQILSKKESNGQTGIQKPCEIRFRDQKVAGSNPVTSTKKHPEIIRFPDVFHIFRTILSFPAIFLATKLQRAKRSRFFIYTICCILCIFRDNISRFLIEKQVLYSSNKIIELFFSQPTQLTFRPIYRIIRRKEAR